MRARGEVGRNRGRYSPGLACLIALLVAFTQSLLGAIQPIAAESAERVFVLPHMTGTDRESADEWSMATGYLAWRTPNPFTSWFKGYRKNPLPYRFVPLVITWHHSIKPVFWQETRRGTWELLTSAVFTGIVRGPEHRWGGLASGLRYNFADPRRKRMAPFLDFRAGVGAIDASDVKYGQSRKLTFIYLIGIGVRLKIDRHSALTVQTLTQHISNCWQTRPSEGVDLTGLAISYQTRF